MKADPATLLTAFVVAKRSAHLSGEMGLLSSCFIELYNLYVTPKEPLTRCQRRVFDFLVSYSEEHGFAPTIVEIGEHFNYSSMSTVHSHLAVLHRKGWVRRQFGMRRGTLIEEGTKTLAEMEALKFPMADPDILPGVPVG